MELYFQESLSILACAISCIRDDIGIHNHGNKNLDNDQPEWTQGHTGVDCGAPCSAVLSTAPLGSGS